MTNYSQISTADGWTGRSVFYEQRVASRSRENERFYHHLVRQNYSFLVPPGASALELGCGMGDLLAAIKPARGVGVDFSARIIGLARQRHPRFEFHTGDAAQWTCSEQFDYLLLADLINDLPDVQVVFERLRALAHPRSRLVLNSMNALWRPFLALAETVGAKAPNLPQNWLSTGDVTNLLLLAGWETVKVEHRILWPLRTSLLAGFLNRWLAPFLPHLCLTIFIVARPRPLGEGRWPQAGTRPVSGKGATPLNAGAARALEFEFEGRMPPTANEGPAPPPVESQARPDYRCSVIIPVRNEAGNIDAAVRRTPEIGLGTELILVEGHSVDGSWAEVQRVAARYPHRNIKVLKQQSKGKGGAVREGFAAATGDVLFILDADLAVAPEELPKFYEAARAGTGELINGVRLVHPMEHEAMRFLNMVANKLFGVAFSWLLGQRIKDSLCGTKVLFRADYERIAGNRGYFGDFDPFGDFDLLFGAARLNLQLVDLPIRYRARCYGETNIRRWRHGWLLLRMVVFAARRLKFR